MGYTTTIRLFFDNIKSVVLQSDPFHSEEKWNFFFLTIGRADEFEMNFFFNLSLENSIEVITLFVKAASSEGSNLISAPQSMKLQAENIHNL